MYYHAVVQQLQCNKWKRRQDDGEFISTDQHLPSYPLFLAVAQLKGK